MSYWEIFFGDLSSIIMSICCLVIIACIIFIGVMFIKSDMEIDFFGIRQRNELLTEIRDKLNKDQS